MTVEAWIKLDDFGAINEWEAFVAKGDGAWRLHRAYGTDKLNFAINNGIGSLNITGTTNIADGGWHHIVGVFDNDNDKLMIYVNGSLDGTSAGVTATIDNTAYKVAIGENLQNTGRYVDGKIDEVRIWNDARTQAEIQANMYTELTGSESNLVAYYNMNGGRGTSLMDLTTNNNTGTL
ncbi:MAG: LamG domain-containing protein, partial [Candidatus Marinimicrobia bacterium]|nr:LamG domain-containing protein [Candidatus Neomarinimicrobiota bacterium]MBT5363847.1 LamG domain-containing protein [Candidatus Neomarinimicrobiota bacterium]MBT5460670.1 LamG domain-containing protein [Candidatus Neomarinimicrobiota bacterium]MBT5759872.1 LamG domain-containing protein [Candidatus Neomarinimicrobiota bacterium]